MKSFKLFLVSGLVALLSACGGPSHEGKFVSPLVDTKYMKGLSLVEIEGDTMTMTQSRRGNVKVKEFKLFDVTTKKTEEIEAIKFKVSQIKSSGEVSDLKTDAKFNIYKNDILVINNEVLLRDGVDYKDISSDYFGDYEVTIRNKKNNISIEENKITISDPDGKRDSKIINVKAILPVLIKDKVKLFIASDEMSAFKLDITIDKDGILYAGTSKMNKI
jgi:hypothetical protein